MFDINDSLNLMFVSGLHMYLLIYLDILLQMRKYTVYLTCSQENYQIFRFVSLIVSLGNYYNGNVQLF